MRILQQQSDYEVGDFDRIAKKYVDVTEFNSFNFLYERPAIRAAADVFCGAQILDAACAGGSHSSWLTERGAQVFGIDRSPNMIRIARERVHENASFQLADLRDPLDFIRDESKDIVLSSLTMHYIRSWIPVFKEFHRVLRPSGTFVFSTHHPLAEKEWFQLSNCPKVELVTQSWDQFGPPFMMKFYCRPVQMILSDLEFAGFTGVIEITPRPCEEMKEKFPCDYHELIARPRFMIYKAFRQ